MVAEIFSVFWNLLYIYFATEIFVTLIERNFMKIWYILRNNNKFNKIHNSISKIWIKFGGDCTNDGGKN